MTILPARGPLGFAAAALAALALGCGGDDPGSGRSSQAEAPERIELEPGRLAEIDGRRWLNLSEQKRASLAAEYIEANPTRCEGAEPTVVADYVASSYGFDFPIDLPVADVIPEGCDASLQGPGAG